MVLGTNCFFAGFPHSGEAPCRRDEIAGAGSSSGGGRRANTHDAAVVIALRTHVKTTSGLVGADFNITKGRVSG